MSFFSELDMAKVRTSVLDLGDALLQQGHALPYLREGKVVFTSQEEELPKTDVKSDNALPVQAALGEVKKVA